jgi:hypothetical protein
MYTNDITNFLIATIETLALKKKTPQFLLAVRFDASVYAKDTVIALPTRYVRVLIDARSNYKGIWIAQHPEWKGIHTLQDEDWKFQSYHDSCWRTDGMRWIFKTWCETREALASALTIQKREVPTAELNANVSITPDSTFFAEVSFEKVQNPESTHQDYNVKDFKLVN